MNLKSLLLYFSCFLAASAYGFIYILSLLITPRGGNSLDIGVLLALAGVATVLLTGFSGYLAKRSSPSFMCAIAMVLCTLGFCIVSLSNSLTTLFYCAGLCLGAGWSLYYATAPMIINTRSEIGDRQRGQYLSRLAALIVLGTSLGPIFSTSALTHGLTIQQYYLMPIILSLVSAILFFLLSKHESDPSKQIKPSSALNKSFPISTILASEAKYPLIMVTLGACILSSMLNFQALYARNHHLNYTIYYLAYMAAVVLSRFILGSFLPKKRNPLTAAPLLLILMMSALFLMIENTNNALLYALSAVILGISYGLIYPLIKTHALNVTEPDYRHDVLAYFSLAYFIGLYGFPLIGGMIIKFYGFTIFLSVLISITFLNFSISIYQHKKLNYQWR